MVVTKEQIDILLSFAVQLHRKIIALTGGVHGVRDEGGLFHYISKLLSRADRGSNPFDICAHSYHEFSTRHHFNDGNKRFSHAFSKILFFKEGHHLEVPYKDALPIIVEIAADRITLPQIKTWVELHSKLVNPERLMEYLITLEEDLAK